MSRTVVTPSSISQQRTLERRVSTLERQANNPAAGSFQPGDLKLTAVTSTPSGWLVADGSTFSATDYPLLYAVLGSTTLPSVTAPAGLTYLIKT